jgi:hypothetical protein
MKKIGLFVMALAAVAILGATAYAASTPAPKAAPAKKMEAKLMTAKGAITTIDVKAGTFNLKGEAATEMTFKASAKLLKGIKAGEMVMVSYKTLPSGENDAVYVKKEKKTHA